MTPSVAPGTVTVFTDVMCGWSTLAFHRFYRARSAAGLDGKLTLDPQLFLLEDVNQMALNTRTIEGEKPVVVRWRESWASRRGNATPRSSR
jgi:hypothetical protein